MTLPYPPAQMPGLPECGCRVHQIVSTEPPHASVTFCRKHAAVDVLTKTLDEVRDILYQTRAHACAGFSCSYCLPSSLCEMIEAALDRAEPPLAEASAPSQSPGPGAGGQYV